VSGHQSPLLLAVSKTRRPLITEPTLQLIVCHTCFRPTFAEMLLIRQSTIIREFPEKSTCLFHIIAEFQKKTTCLPHIIAEFQKQSTNKGNRYQGRNYVRPK
jgi:hypothetical protein